MNLQFEISWLSHFGDLIRKLGPKFITIGGHIVNTSHIVHVEMEGTVFKDPAYGVSVTLVGEKSFCIWFPKMEDAKSLFENVQNQLRA